MLNALLKLSIAAAVLFASASVGYYYLLYLPQRDAQLDAERSWEKAQADARERADQERASSEKRAAEQRHAEEKAAAQLHYQNCLLGAESDYNSNWTAACQRKKAVSAKGYNNCVSGGLSKDACSSIWASDPSANCGLPHEIATTLNEALEKARDRCLQESRAGLQ